MSGGNAVSYTHLVIHHHPAFDVDESVLHHGAGIYVRFAVDYLEKNCR